MEMLIRLVCLAWELQPDAANIAWPVFTRSQKERAQVIFLPGSPPRARKMISHTILRFEGKYSVRSDLSSDFSSCLQLLSSSSSLSSIPHLNNWHYHPSATRKKNPSWNWQTVLEDPCLGPVESAEKKGRSRIYPHGTHSLRGKIQLLIPPPEHASQ